ncbi:hypothetical protein ATANTOWER_003502 [Ataeniobius toweri]|uniref:Uncharacterized protein n=1 Tax=Ataeniobius toweri TaxID=208326 RepID=A0ABU7AU91_9TELE|nr:hypothetical protein [Ataeniobius toweri]
MGGRRGLPWTGRQSIAGQGNTQTTMHTLIHTPKGNLERPINLTGMSLECGRKPEYPVKIWTLSLLSLRTTDSEPGTVLELEPSPTWQSRTPGRSPQSESCPPSDINLPQTRRLPPWQCVSLQSRGHLNSCRSHWKRSVFALSKVVV